MTEVIYDMTDEDLSRFLIGKTIRAIEGKNIELTDGTVLSIADAQECCAWFQGDIEAFDFEDNVITAVEEVESEARDPADMAWQLHVLSNHKKIAQVNIEGDPSSGYYVHSVNLFVERAQND